MNLNPTIKLQQTRVSTADTSAEGSNLKIEANVVVEGRLLIQRTAFLGHSFLPEDVPVVSFFKELLNEMMVKCLSGERPEVNQVHEKVKKRILDANIFVGLFTRRDKIEGKELWRTTDWVIEEMSFAAAKGKKLLLLREHGVADFGGLQGNQEYIEFDRNNLHLSAAKLIQSLWSLNPGRVKFQSNKPPEIGIEVLRVAAEANPDDPTTRIVLAQQLRQAGHVHEAIREIDTVLTASPTYAPALYVKAQCLRAFGQKDSAKSVLAQLVDISPSDANIRHELAHVMSDLGDDTTADNEFQIAEDCDPGNPRHYKCHADLIVRMAKGRTEQLNKAIQLYELACEIGGKQWQTNLEQQLIGVRSRLARATSESDVTDLEESTSSGKRPR
jgi:tetratricopeptide (TPR) repeat protein